MQFPLDGGEALTVVNASALCLAMAALQARAAALCRVALRCDALQGSAAHGTGTIRRGLGAHAYKAPRWVRVRQVVQYNMALCVGARHDALHASRYALVRICELLIAAGVDSFGACAPRRVRRPVAEQRKRVQRSGVASLGAWRSRRRGLPGCVVLGAVGTPVNQCVVGIGVIAAAQPFRLGLGRGPRARVMSMRRFHARRNRGSREYHRVPRVLRESQCE